MFGQEVCGEGSLSFASVGTYTLQLSIVIGGDLSAMTSTGTYSVDGDTITTCEDDDCETSTLTLRGDMITMSLPDGGLGCTLSISGSR